MDENNGKAEFDKTRKCLTVTLPVLTSSLSPSLPSPPPPPPPPPPPTTTSQSTNQMTESHDSENHESANHVAPLDSRDPDQEQTNQIVEVESCDSKPSDGEMKSCDPEGQELTNDIAEQESHDMASKQLTNQIIASNNQSLPTTTADSETIVTSSNISTNHSTEPSHMTWTSKGDWVAPSFTYRQDDKRVVFVLHSSGIKPSTLVHHHDNHQVYTA